MPNHTTRPGTELVRAKAEAAMRELGLDPAEMLTSQNAMPMRVSGGMQGGPVVGEGLGLPAPEYVHPGFNPNRQELPAPPTPKWLVEREEAVSRLIAGMQGAIDKLEARLVAVEHPTPANDTEKRVNDMIDDLSARKVSTPDRARLRGAIDKAEKPLAGRAGQDEALGNAIGRTSGWRPL